MTQETLMSPPQSLEARVAALKARRAALDARLHGIEEALDETPSKDWEEAATEREGDEVLEHLGQAGLEEIKMIDLALARAEAGEYGICVRCGEEISPARLDVLPYTPVCRTCAKG